MPRFTITRDGKPVSQIDAHGDRIELGSARTCQVLIDDLLISLKQAAFVRASSAEKFMVEPVSRIPAFTLDGLAVEGPVEVRDGAILAIEGYSVTIGYLPGEIVVPGAPAAAPAAGARVSSFVPSDEPPLPPPLEPDLPPPLEESKPKIPEPVATAPIPAARSENADMERTVFVRRIGKLVATAGPLQGQSWDLKSGETRIGRESGQNDIVIRFDAQGNVDNSVSRRHASVHVIGDKIFVEDAGSAAGTFVNGTAVPARQRVEVRAQDLIEIRSSRESTLLRVELQRAATAPPPGPSPSPAPQAAPVATPDPPPLRTPAPQHEAPRPGDYAAEEPPVVRRRRRESAPADNLFVPAEEPRKGGKIPTWGWIVAGAGIVLLIVIILLIAL